MAKVVTEDQDAQRAHDIKTTSKSERRKARREAQHRQWMRVMMEGQATPDPRYTSVKN